MPGITSDLIFQGVQQPQHSFLLSPAAIKLRDLRQRIAERDSSFAAADQAYEEICQKVDLVLVQSQQGQNISLPLNPQVSPQGAQGNISNIDDTINAAFDKVMQGLQLTTRIQEQHEELKQEINAELQVLNGRIDRLEDKLESLTGRVDTAKQSLQETEANLEQQKLKLVTLSEKKLQIRKLVEEKASLKDRLYQIQQDQSMIKARVEQLMEGPNLEVVSEDINHFVSSLPSHLLVVGQAIKSAANQALVLAQDCAKAAARFGIEVVWSYIKDNTGPITWVAAGVFASYFIRDARVSYPLISLTVLGVGYLAIKNGIIMLGGPKAI